MKKLLALLLLALFVVSCSKDEPYITTPESIVGTWKSEILLPDPTSDKEQYYIIITYTADGKCSSTKFFKIYPSTEWGNPGSNEGAYLLTGNYLYYYNEKGELDDIGTLVQIKGNKMIQTIKRKNPVTGKDLPDIVVTYYRQ